MNEGRLIMPKDILYRPELGYSKNYYTEGKINSAINQTDNSSSEGLSQEDKINILINSIEDKMNFLSDDLISTYLPPYYGMKDEYDRLINDRNDSNKEQNNDKDDDSNNTISPDNPIITVDPNPSDRPPLFEDLDNLILNPDEDKKDPADIIKDIYYVDFLDIYEDYLGKLEMMIQNYIMTTLQSLASNPMVDMLTDYNTISINNEDLKHLSDFLIKSGISLSQTMRLHKKLYNIDEIILHVRSIRVSNDQRIRYNSIKELDQKTYIDVDSNVVLKESIRVSEKKYEENLYGLYKYLNSSVILLDESLKTISKQNKAMIIINNYEERDKK